MQARGDVWRMIVDSVDSWW